MIQEADDGGDFVIRQGLMTGDGEFLGVDELGDGQRKGIPVFIAFLLVGRNRIMNLGLDAVVSEVTLEFVTMLTEDWEDVIDAVAISKDRTRILLRGSKK